MNNHLSGQEAISQAFINYWNEWHKEWYLKASTWTPLSNQSLEKVGDWNIPSFIGDDKCTPSWEFLPEPYWGNPSGNLETIFLNINPGLGGNGQNISTIKSTKDPLHPLQDYRNSYSNFIKRIIDDFSPIDRGLYYGRSLLWWNDKVAWAGQVLERPITIHQALGAELAPWHTKGTSKELSHYIKSHMSPLKTYVFEPLLELAKRIVNNVFNSTIICRGVDVARAIEVVYPNCVKKEFTLLYEDIPYFRANTYRINDASIIVFFGQGNYKRGMSLPSEERVHIENHGSSSLKELIVTLKCGVRP